MRLYEQFAAILLQPGMQLARVRLAQPQHRVGFDSIVSDESAGRAAVCRHEKDEALRLPAQAGRIVDGSGARLSQEVVSRQPGHEQLTGPETAGFDEHIA